MHYIKIQWYNNDWYNIVKIHNVGKYKINNLCTLLQIPAKGAKCHVIAAVKLTGQSNPCLGYWPNI